MIIVPYNKSHQGRQDQRQGLSGKHGEFQLIPAFGCQALSMSSNISISPISDAAWEKRYGSGGLAPLDLIPIDPIWAKYGEKTKSGYFTPLIYWTTGA